MKTTSLILALGLSALAVDALAQAGPAGGAGGPMMERLKKADTNGDGMISREEAKALPRINEHFDEIDTNKDGQITMDELHAFHEKQKGGHFKKMDTDGDGKISRAEAAKFPKLSENFDKLDTNKDGFLSPEELKAARGRGGQ